MLIKWKAWKIRLAPTIARASTSPLPAAHCPPALAGSRPIGSAEIGGWGPHGKPRLPIMKPIRDARPRPLQQHMTPNTFFRLASSGTHTTRVQAFCCFYGILIGSPTHSQPRPGVNCAYFRDCAAFGPTLPLYPTDSERWTASSITRASSAPSPAMERSARSRSAIDRQYPVCSAGRAR